ncbi:glycoside hydrolase family 19 protein [Streptomyces sp. RP5T]|uniref:glycoside hydrolase family 19 protein n=1 Tax=Streptomyces sp. RP5T TaxID=2490848 RepID=UPI000F646BBD|nr:glycoside hydrolase family 19 protein [Streptomyces sp. RP5T]RRR79279.1 chitinase [Streptomyces sp. RP5T]
MLPTIPRPTRRRSGRLTRVGLAAGSVLAVAAALLSSHTPDKILPAAGSSSVKGPIIGLAGKCVDVAGANSANGTPVQLFDCNGTDAQLVTKHDDGTLRVFDKCLDVDGADTTAGTAVQLWECHGAPNQQWVVTEAQDIVNPAADKCLDVRDNNSANGARLQIWTCTGAANQKWAEQGSLLESRKAAPAQAPGSGGDFVVSETQFNEMFPNRDPFYTYSGLTAALSAYSGFATAGNDTVRKQETAAFLANIGHETGGLVHIVEQNTTNYPHYCDLSQSYGCPAGQDAYYGRGPIQLSWNYNYKAAGDALGIDLLNNPGLVQNDATVAWKTGLWYWNTQSGPGTMTPHDAMANQAGFGQTIRSLNGALECEGRNTAQVQSRVDSYRHFTQILNVPPGDNLSC